MDQTLVIALLAGLGGMVGWGAADFFAKKAVDEIGPITSLVWAHVFGTVTFALILLVQTVILGRAVVLPEGAGSWLGLAGFGTLQMLVYWFAYQAFEKGQLAILNPIFASFAGLVAVASIVFFNEQLSVLLGLALVVIFGGVIALNLDLKATGRNKLAVTPGLKEILIATILAAAWTIGWDRFIEGRDALSSATAMYVFMSLSAFALSLLMRTKIPRKVPIVWKSLVLMGASETLAYLTVSWGYAATDKTSVVALVSGAFSVPTVILAYIFLKERLNALQFGAIVAIVVGIALIALS